MSPLNLDNVSGFLPIERLTSVAGPLGVEAGGTGSFDELLERAGQTAPLPSTTSRDAQDAADTPVRGSRSEADDHQDAADDTSAAETAENATPRTDPPDAEDEQPKEALPSVGNEAAPLNGQVAVEPEQSADHADMAPSEEKPDGEVGGCQQQDDDRRASSPKQDNNRIAPQGEPLPEQSEESGQAQTETPPPDSGLAVSKAEDAKAARGLKIDQSHEQPDRQPVQPTRAKPNRNNQPGEDTPVSSKPAGSPSEDTGSEVQASGVDTPAHNGQHVRENRSVRPVDLQASGPQAPDAEHVSGQKNITIDSQTTSTNAAVWPNEIAPGTGDNDTGASTSPRVASNQPSPPGSATEGGSNSGVDQVDRVRFVQRVARAFEAAGDRAGSVRLRLHPPELGSLRLELTVRNGLLTARLEAETTSTRNLLLDNLPALRQRLAEHEIKVERFDVDLGNRSSGGSPREPGGHPHWQDRPGRDAPQAGTNYHARTESSSRPKTPARPDRLAADGQNQFDVVI